MSTSEILQPNENMAIGKGASDHHLDEKKKVNDEIVTTKKLPAEEENDEKEPVEQVKEDDSNESKVRLSYSKDELLELRKASISLEKPNALSEEFYNKDGIWDPEAWFKSDISRSSSPAVIDGKPVLDEKKADLLEDDGIALTPHRGSFREGCQVKASGLLNTVLPKIGGDRKNRLTGRAASQRKQIDTNYKDSDSISERTHEFEKLRRDKTGYFSERESYGAGNDKDRGYNRFNNSNTKQKNFPNESRASRYRTDSGSNYNQNKREAREEAMPEWMTDGPTSQLDTIDLPTYKDIEEEKKAFAKKNKKVRISPNVETQEIHKESKPPKAKRRTPSPKNGMKETKSADEKSGFELNDFFQSVDYYPPKMFEEDMAYGDGVKSRFTQYFQNQKQPRQPSPNHTTPKPIGELVPDEVFTGSRSPVLQQPFFTPIQPAPALLSAAANAQAVQTNNIANIIQKQREQKLEENLKEANREVRGRLSLAELEAETVKKQQQQQQNVVPTSTQQIPPTQQQPQLQNHQQPADKTVFDMFLKTMKDAGQLPDKPSPVVTGLPGHLLPQPPTRTSPVFEKLKRSLSRSPSPKEFVKAVSTVAGIIATNPSIDSELDILQGRNPPPVGMMPISNGNEPLSNHSTLVKPEALRTPKTPTNFPIEGGRSSTNTPSSHAKKTPMKNPFTPTSVLKKMHSDRKDDVKSPLLSNLEKDKSAIEQNLHQQFQNEATPDRKQSSERFDKSNVLPLHSAPATPRNSLNQMLRPDVPISASAPGTPEHRRGHDPPFVNRFPLQSKESDAPSSAFDLVKGASKSEPILLAPSAFQSAEKPAKKVGVIGSGAPSKSVDGNLSAGLNHLNLNGEANPKLAPGSGVHISPRDQITPSSSGPSPIGSMPQGGKVAQPLSQQQQLLQAQRIAQIQQAQLVKQNKLREIAKHANQQQHLKSLAENQGHVNGAHPLLPDSENSGQQQQQQQQMQQQQQQQHRPMYQQSQHQQLLAYQQQQKQQMLAQHQRQMRNNSMGFGGGNQMRPQHQMQQPPLPIPMQPPPSQQMMGGFQQPFQQNNQFNPAGLNNVNLTAQVLAQQQLINQARARLLQEQLQPRVVQAALMAQAALVRGQAQAQAAMMLNPRNLQAMAQLGLVPPFNQKKHPQPPHQQMGQNGHMPNPAQPNLTQNDGGQASGGGDNVLSKWFSNDVLQKMPSNKGSGQDGPAKIMSVEELERLSKE